MVRLHSIKVLAVVDAVVWGIRETIQIAYVFNKNFDFSESLGVMVGIP